MSSVADLLPRGVECPRPFGVSASDMPLTDADRRRESLLRLAGIIGDGRIASAV